VRALLGGNAVEGPATIALLRQHGVDLGAAPPEVVPLACGCGQRAMARPGAKLVCGDCLEVMHPKSFPVAVPVMVVPDDYKEAQAPTFGLGRRLRECVERFLHEDRGLPLTRGWTPELIAKDSRMYRALSLATDWAFDEKYGKRETWAANSEAWVAAEAVLEKLLFVWETLDDDDQ
jgi:hypothetical protein